MQVYEGMTDLKLVQILLLYVCNSHIYFGKAEKNTCYGLPKKASSAFGDPSSVMISMNGDPLVGGVSNSSSYPFNTTIQITCPCGYEWSPAATTSVSSWRQRTGNRTTITVRCLGTLGWASYDITTCLQSNIHIARRIQEADGLSCITMFFQNFLLIEATTCTIISYTQTTFIEKLVIFNTI
jgi:hypothetical protein